MLPRRLLASFARFVLACFVLHLGAGVAAPVLRADAGLQFVCAGGLMKLEPGPGDDGGLAKHASIQCPLCGPAIAPPPAIVRFAALRSESAPAIAQRVVSASRPPLALPPARAPPALLLA